MWFWITWVTKRCRELGYDFEELAAIYPFAEAYHKGLTPNEAVSAAAILKSLQEGKGASDVV